MGARFMGNRVRGSEPSAKSKELEGQLDQGQVFHTAGRPLWQRAIRAGSWEASNDGVKFSHKTTVAGTGVLCETASPVGSNSARSCGRDGALPTPSFASQGGCRRPGLPAMLQPHPGRGS